MKKQTDNPQKDGAENPKKKGRGKYEEKLKVKGSFLDIIRASVKDADAKASKKKKSTPK